jgi:hypothetical protein
MTTIAAVTAGSARSSSAEVYAGASPSAITTIATIAAIATGQEHGTARATIATGTADPGIAAIATRPACPTGHTAGAAIAAVTTIHSVFCRIRVGRIGT